MMDVRNAQARDAQEPVIFRREAYLPPAFAVDGLELDVMLDPQATKVKAKSVMRCLEAGAPLVLDGQDMKLLSVSLNGMALSDTSYELLDERLVIPNVPGQFTLDIETEINPAANTSLEGLYLSRGLYTTQCEAEGFRKITYFLDRPDVMTRYRVRITADKARCPVLLSNGNLIEERDLEEGCHTALWEDPFPKPSYLFALVAGDLAHMEDKYTTMSGREVTLRIYAAERDLDKCDHAMESLKASMKWDEEVFGLEYDLDIYNIVAVSDFNMGAMENKSLNVFNTKCVLARPETATDLDFAAVEGVIAHEYFHNWTGNRVTCRDWFQLSLKEGLTVFRDQEFSADRTSRAVKRIEDVRMLRTHQFPEDAGPLAHPVRPDSYMEINNFYTATVYEKGAEVIRMMHRLLGPEGFRKGMDLYFERHDGQAVTCDDFVAAMEDASGVDLGQFRLWYSQAGTPVVEASGTYDEATQSYRLSLRQFTPPTPGQTEKESLHIPVAVGLLGPNGHNMDFRLANVPEDRARPDQDGTVLLDLKEREQVFRFENVAAPPVPSILRGFSAPVRVRMERSRDDLRFLMANDSDSFNRWEAGQRLATGILFDLVDRFRDGGRPELNPADRDAFRATLLDRESDPALIAETLTLPSESDLAGEMDEIDTDAIHRAREFLRARLGADLREDFLAIYDENRQTGPYRYTAEDVARRRLKNLALAYLMVEPDDTALALAREQLRSADNMTDESAALRALVHSGHGEAEPALEEFYAKWKDEDLVIDKWFSIQATSPQPDVLDRLEELRQHTAFTLRNPNRLRALVGAFAQLNQVRFHDVSGRGYAFLRRQVQELDGINPQVAARILAPLGRWQRHMPKRQDMMKQELEALLRLPNLSRDVYEVVTKSLGTV